jgi:hypothetical protein
MKRNSLTTALLAGLAGAAGLATTANAVNINPDGLGQVLIFPYYTVNKGNQTLVSVVNTTNRTKAVKVRFLEGRNSKEVLDFNLYLSPFDVWTGAVFATGATGPGNLVTTDTSCTVPDIRNRPGGTVPFRNYEYSGALKIDHPTSLIPTLSALERTREGHLEMIEMGVLQTGTAPGQLADEATHNPSTGVPVNCAALVAAWVDIPPGVWFTNGAANIDTPAGGIYGAGTIVDVAGGNLQAYNGVAAEGFYTNASAPGALHFNPGSIRPDLGDADNSTVAAPNVINSFIFAQNGAAVVTEQLRPQQRTLSTNLPYSYDAVSLLFMHDAIYNEYVTDAALGASTEWVITFPTKRSYVDVAAATLVRTPFTNPFRDNGSACEAIQVAYWNREEAVADGPTGGVDFSPPPPDVQVIGPALCFEAQVLSFNQSAVAAGNPSAVFGSTYASNINTARNATANFTSGWSRIGFRANPLNVLNMAFAGFTDTSQYFGLPVTGFWAANYVNANVTAGVLANYSGAYAHRASRASSG